MWSQSPKNRAAGCGRCIAFLSSGNTFSFDSPCKNIKASIILLVLTLTAQNSLNRACTTHVSLILPCACSIWSLLGHRVQTSQESLRKDTRRKYFSGASEKGTYGSQDMCFRHACLHSDKEDGIFISLLSCGNSIPLSFAGASFCLFGCFPFPSGDCVASTRTGQSLPPFSGVPSRFCPTKLRKRETAEEEVGLFLSA